MERKKTPPPTEEQLAKIRSLADGRSKKAIALETGVSNWWVRKALPGYRVTARSTGKPETLRQQSGCRHYDCIYSIVLSGYRACDYYARNGCPKPYPAAECPGYYEERPRKIIRQHQCGNCAHAAEAPDGLICGCPGSREFGRPVDYDHLCRYWRKDDGV